MAMPRLHLIFWVTLAMLAFAGNSLLCRMALQHTSIDPASFVTLRLASGACMLWLLVRLTSWLQRGKRSAASAMVWGAGNWLSAAALFAYAAAFSFAYTAMSAATGALLLFGAVQATMIGYGVAHGERLRPLQLAGVALALAGLVALMLPGLAAPPLPSALSMVAAGMAWGVYSLRGKRVQARHNVGPTQITAGNFLRAVPMALALSLLMAGQGAYDLTGLGLATVSGAVASGLGYAIWYHALPALKATHAATVQLSVPVIAALGGIALLGETFTLTLALASCAILGGIALVIWDKKIPPPVKPKMPP
jgi:drug/metabolite transporter (DMT)-like permease